MDWPTLPMCKRCKCNIKPTVPPLPVNKVSGGHMAKWCLGCQRWQLAADSTQFHGPQRSALNGPGQRQTSVQAT
eukprot:1152382-Pelagomonas_calceolata.AAC.1